MIFMIDAMPEKPEAAGSIPAPFPSLTGRRCGETHTPRYLAGRGGKPLPKPGRNHELTIKERDKMKREKSMEATASVSVPKSLPVLSSIGACRKAADLLIEAGARGGAAVELRGEPCPGAGQPHSVQPEFVGHRIVVLDDNNMVCRACGKRFRIRRRPLTTRDRIVFAALNPEHPFSARLEIQAIRS